MKMITGEHQALPEEMLTKKTSIYIQLRESTYSIFPFRSSTSVIQTPYRLLCGVPFQLAPGASTHP